jgi:hypothetical protein
MDVFQNLTVIEAAKVLTGTAHRLLVDYEPDGKLDTMPEEIQRMIQELIKEAMDTDESAG